MERWSAAAKAVYWADQMVARTVAAMAAKRAVTMVGQMAEWWADETVEHLVDLTEPD